MDGGYDPSEPVGAPSFSQQPPPHAQSQTQPSNPSSAVSTPPILLDGVDNDVSTPTALAIPPPTDSQPSAASFAPPSFALPGLRSEAAPIVDAAAAVVNEVLDDADELKHQSEEALENLREVERLEVELRKTAADYAGAAVGGGAGGDDHDMDGMTIAKDGLDKETNLEKQVEDVPLPNEITAAPVHTDKDADVSAATTTAASPAPPQNPGGDESDAEGEIDFEMDVVDNTTDELAKPTEIVAPSAESAPVVQTPAPSAAPAPAAPAPAAPPASTTPTTESPRTPPVTRRPPNLQRRSPTYDAGPPPPPGPTAAIGAKSSLPPRPPVAPSAGTGAGADHSHSRRSSSSVGAGSAPGAGARSLAGLPASPGRGRTQPKQRDWDAVAWPVGLGKDSPSVRRYPSLVEAWLDSEGSPQSLLALFEASCTDGEVADARAWFAVFEKDNPTATRPLLDLINLELAHNNFAQVVALFEKALRGLGGSVGAVPGVDIWRSYLHYIRRQNPIPSVTSSSSSAQQAAADAVREVVKSAYELAIKECGNDVDSGEIWKEYIAFLAEREGTTSWEVQQQQDAIRSVYQRAVVIPLANVEQLWREYDQFENKLNKVTAKKFLAERSPLYMTARKALRELRQHTEALTPSPVIPPRPTWAEADRALAINWKKYLKWEESNPLDIEESSALQARVIYAMRKCLTHMRFFPELWFHVASYLQTQGRLDEAGAYLKTGVDANPRSFLLTFAYAEHEETKKNNAAAHAAYERLIAEHGASIDKLKVSIEKEVEQAKGPEIPVDENEEDIEMVGAGPSETRKRQMERDARGQAVRDRRAVEVEDLTTAAGVIWVMYMRFVRRAEGMKAARVLFGTARKSPYIAWHVYEAAASMEYVCNNQASIATKIFELGLKAFPEEVPLAVKFLQFQLQINDEANARALFERLVLKFPPEKARPVWDLWARHEYTYGDLAACQKMEARFAEAYPSESPLKRFASRYSYQGIDQILVRDLGFGVKSTAVAPHPPVSVPAKRPLREESPARLSPRIPEPRYRDDRPPPPRDDGPPKRPRPSSPPRDRQRDRWAAPPENTWGGRREVSPPPRRMEVRAQPPPPMPPVEPMDRSGLPKSVVWFLGNLPSARTFDGPLFRPDDLMNVLATVSMPGANGGPRSSRMPDHSYRGPPTRR